MKEMGVRSILIRWLASYLNERSHFTQFGKEASDFVYVTEGVLEGSKLGPIVFVTKVNMLPNVIEQVAQGGAMFIIMGMMLMMLGGARCS